MQASNSPSKSPVPFAESGSKNTIPVDSQIGVTPGLASFTDGFPPLTMTPLTAGGIPPRGQDFNGILYFLSAAVRWAQAGGGYQYDDGFATAIGGYPAGSILRSNDGTQIWLSLSDNNVTDPAAGPSANWAEVAKLVSPAFTGTPTAPTPAATDRSTRLATTAFVAGNFPQLYSIAALPVQDVGPIIVIECAEVWTWASTSFFTGYRSLLCGRPLDGHTAAPLASEVDAVGGLLPKDGAYAGLWGYAQEEGLVRTEAVWQANRGAHWFSDYSATQFRVPDLRDMFRRFTGTDLDTATARAMGSRQADQVGPLAFLLDSSAAQQTSGPGWFMTAGTSNKAGLLKPGQVSANTGSETRPSNTAYHPRIHV